MNRRYIDFVPTKSNQPTVKRGQAAVRVTHAKMPKATTTRVASVAKRTVPRVTTTQKSNVTPRISPAPRQSTPVMAKTPSRNASPEFALGVVEDLGTKFVKTEVQKRPLSRKPTDNLTEAKAKKVKAAKSLKITQSPVEKPVEKSLKKPVDNTYKPPKTPFINQEKVVKRPLSKNVYQKKIVAPKEVPKGPVTIISKPEKETHVGIIVTIIITVVLGAAAGTVAFLLLPK